MLDCKAGLDCHRPASYPSNHPEACLRAATHKRLSCCNCWPLKSCHAFAPATCKRMSSYRCPLAFGDFELQLDQHHLKKRTKVKTSQRAQTAKSLEKRQRLLRTGLWVLSVPLCTLDWSFPPGYPLIFWLEKSQRYCESASVQPRHDRH